MSEGFSDTKPLGYFSSINTYKSYNWVNNESFYSLVPYPAHDYYVRFVKQYFYWYDGYVPSFHIADNGMFSTRLAYTILHNLANRTVGNKLLFDDEGEADKRTINIKGRELNSLEFVEYWSEKFGFDNKVTQAFEWAYAGGDSIIKLDSDGKNLIPTVVRKDSYFIDTDFRGNISNTTCLIYTYVKQTSQDEGSAGEKQFFYLLEDRKYDEKTDKPMIRLSIKRGYGNSLAGKSVDKSPETIPFDRLPNNVRHQFKRDYPKVELGEWQELPLDNIGVFFIKASEKISFLPNMPYGESLLSNLIHILMAYDYYYSSLVTNMYTSRNRVLVPAHMQVPRDTENGYVQNQFQGLDSFLINQLPYSDPDGQKPVNLEFSLRAEDWMKIRNNLLQNVAMLLNVDTRDISSDVVSNSEKPTAREISSDEYKTTLFVERKQKINKPQLDECIATVLRFYNFKEEVVSVKFSKAGLTNLNNVSTIVTTMKQNGLMDTRTAVELFFDDKNKKQIDEIVKRIEEEKEKAQEMQQQKMETDVDKKRQEENNTDINHVPKPKE